MRSTLVKLGTGFILGAVIVGGVATAASTPNTSVKACVDNRTKAMYLSTNGSCSASRTLVDLGTTVISNTPTIDPAGTALLSVKTIAAAVTPSVVSVGVESSAGSGTGSGWIYKSSDKSSYIVTNNHVIETAANSGTITIEFNDGEKTTATIVGRDPIYDLAVLQIKLGNLPVVTLGDSSKISVGDPVVAIGSPLGLSSTVTSGIVSALNRPVVAGSLGSESYVDAIQTDAAINPGNSGGALLDGQGRLIGVNSAIATLSSGSASGSIGLGFSIPINEAKRIIDEIIATGKSSRPVLGVYFDTTYTGVGAKIVKLSAGEGAEKAGIPVGSVLRAIDGVKTNDRDTAIVRIRSYAPGTTISVLVDLPGGGQKTFKVMLGSAPSM